MKVYIGPYTNWFGPYQLAELLCFWVPKVKDKWGLEDRPDWVHDFGDFLAHGFNKRTEEDERKIFFNKDRPKTLLYKFLLWIDSLKKRRQYIKIDRYDTWGMYNTLAPIILPMLKQLKETKHGSAHVDMMDVPEYMRTHSHEEWDNQMCFSFYSEDEDHERKYNIHDRWDWVLDEMIHAFECIVDDSWEEKYSSGEMDHYSDPCEWDENGKPTLYNFKEGPNHTYKCDYEAIRKEYERIDNGLMLFGKYFRSLWD